MTLALLLTAVTGAWADETPIATILASENSTFVSGSKTFADKVKITFSGAVDWVNNRWQVVYDSTNGNEGTVTVEGVNGTNISKVVFYDEYGSHVMTTSPYTLYFYQAPERSDFIVCTGANGEGETDLSTITKIEVFGGSAPSGPEVAWDAATKTGTFTMPGSDVVLTPIYAKAAAFATTGTEPEVKTLLPAAAEGVIAGTDASLIAEGTGIVAFAGTSTEDTQGTLMYAIGTSATEAPALTDFSATVPTAKNIADDGATVYVWYYIQGADAPDGEAATLDNTFDNTEPACLTVQVLTNKFDIQFNAANANTIESGKATVTVGGTDKTVTEGKLQGVKMGSEVKVKANTGYKFRKVEVKKAEAGPLAAAFKDGAKFKVGYKWNSVNTTYLEFTNSGGTYSLTSVSGLNEANGFNSSTLTVKDGNVLALDVVCHPEGTSKMDRFCAQIEFDATSSTYKYSSKGSGFTGIISVSVNDADITSQLTEAN